MLSRKCLVDVPMCRKSPGKCAKLGYWGSLRSVRWIVATALTFRGRSHQQRACRAKSRQRRLRELPGPGIAWFRSGPCKMRSEG